MTASCLDSRTLDVRRMVHPSMTPEEVIAMTAMLRKLSYSTMGKRLLEVALTHNLRLSFASRWSLWHLGRGVAGAQYCPGRFVIRIGRRFSIDAQLVMLAHELQHFCDETLGWGQGWTINSEMRAQQSEGLVAIELNLRVRSHALDARGALRSGRDIAASLWASKMYSDFPVETPRLDGRLHPLATNEELRPGLRERAFSLSPAPILVAGPRAETVTEPTDTAWCPVPVEPNTSANRFRSLAPLTSRY